LRRLIVKLDPFMGDGAEGDRCVFLPGTSHRELILDTDRQAHAAQWLMKLYENGASVWRKVEATPPTEPE
jgi:hypothetical protein